MWITGCHDTKDFWNAYWQRYAKLLRNRPFSPQIICENLWFGLKPQISLFTQFFTKIFLPRINTNFHKPSSCWISLNPCEPWQYAMIHACHKLTQIPTNNLLVESRGIRVSPQKTTNRRASVRFPTIKRKSGICEICVSHKNTHKVKSAWAPKTPTKWDLREPKNTHKAKSVWDCGSVGGIFLVNLSEILRKKLSL